MSYVDFKQYLLRYLQRDGDAILLLDLDIAIRNAEARLTRDMRTGLLQQIAQSLSLTALDMPLPADWRTPKGVYLSTGETLRPTSFDNLMRLRLTASPGRLLGFYTIRGTTISFAGGNPSPARPVTVLLDYVPKVTSYQDTDISNVRDTFPDLYDYAVLSELPMYLRDDERLAGMEGTYQARLLSVNNFAAEQEWGGAPLGSMLPEGIV